MLDDPDFPGLPGERRRLLDRPDLIFPMVGIVVVVVLLVGAVTLAVIAGLAARGF